MLEMIEQAMRAEDFAPRPRHRPTLCTCPMPECKYNHEGEALAIDERARRKTVTPEWLADTYIDAYRDPLLWQFFAAGDDIEFCRRLRVALEEEALAEANQEAKKS